MKKIISLSFLFLILSLSIISVYAVSQDEFNQAKALIDSNITCNKLTNDQLEIIGEYYMEQMHPGGAHELMHKMMGLTEGSEAEEQFHINMAKTIYCGESGGMIGSRGMIGMMNMMGGGMMGSYPTSYDYSNYGYWNIFRILLFAAVIFFIVWIIHRFGIKKTASETPLNILRKRFAKGEITKKELEDMKNEMGG